MESIKSFEHCRDTICNLGPKYGYLPEATKPYLIIKENFKEKANSIFKGSTVQITSPRRTHLRGASGKMLYKEKQLIKKRFKPG